MSMTEGYRSMMMISFVREEEEKKEAMPLIEILKREKKLNKVTYLISSVRLEMKRAKKDQNIKNEMMTPFSYSRSIDRWKQIWRRRENTHTHTKRINVTPVHERFLVVIWIILSNVSSLSNCFIFNRLEPYTCLDAWICITWDYYFDLLAHWQSDLERERIKHTKLWLYVFIDTTMSHMFEKKKKSRGIDLG